jgi:hypothetical protein
MKRFKPTTAWTFAIALAFAIVLLAAPLALAGSGGPIPPARAAEAAAKLVSKVAAAGGQAGGMPNWVGARVGEALLVEQLDGSPSEYVVPVQDAGGKTISTIGIDAVHGDWHWYGNYLLGKFPLVSESEADSEVNKLAGKRRYSLSALPSPVAKIAPDKSIYWVFKPQGSQASEFYAPAFTSDAPSSNLDGKPWEKVKPATQADPAQARAAEAAAAPAAGGSGAQGLVRAIKPGAAPAAYGISGVPYHVQATDYWCGPASLEMVMDYYGPDINQAEIAGVANSSPSIGVYNNELARAAQFSEQSASIQDPALRGYTNRKLGYGMASESWKNGTALFDRRYTDLKDLVSQNIPVLVLTYYWNPPSSGHFRVVKGYNDNLGVFIVHDPWYSGSPSGPNVNFNQSQFVDTLWQYSDRWGMIAVPWMVSLHKPYSVTAGQNFNVSADVTYVGPAPLSGQYGVTGAAATLDANGSDYQIVSGPASVPVSGIGSSGSAGTATWTVRALHTRKTDNMQVTAQGLVSGNTDDYHAYTDWIGGVGTTGPAPGPTSRSWGHDSIGVPSPSARWYLAEGCTGGGFETWILVQNPDAALAADVQLTFQTPGGKINGPAVSIPPSSRMTFNVSDWVPNEYNVSTTVDSDPPVVAERAVYAYNRTVGTDSVGVRGSLDKWYLPEGSTNGGMETWILVQNPNPQSAQVTLSFQTPHGAIQGPVVTVDENSRRSFNVAEYAPNEWSVSTIVTATRPVVAERSMYGNNRAWGHDSIGAASPAKTWYLAEGCTNGGFETWVLVQNPNAQAASVTLTYMTESGQVNGPTMNVPANSRQTFFVADTVPSDWSVSTKVTSNIPVIAERSMYGNNRTWGHDSIGVTQPETTWYLAEGCTNTGFESWVLVQNPNDQNTVVTLTYMTPAGPVQGPSETLPPRSRKTYNIADTVPWEWQVSTRVVGSRPIIAERAMYGDHH